MVDRPIYNQRIGREFTECAIWRDRVIEYVAKSRPDIVVMGSSHTYEFSREAWKEGTSSVLSRIAPYTSKLVIMRSTPVLPFNGAGCIGSRLAAQDFLASDDSCTASSLDPHNDQVAEWLAEAAAEWPSARVIDMNDLVCPDQLCSSMHADDVMVFRDTQHLNAGFAAALSVQLADRLGVVKSKGAP